MKKLFQPIFILTLISCCCSLVADAQLASDKVNSIAARRNRKSLVITRTVLHEPVTVSSSSRLSSNIVSPAYIQARLPISMRSGTVSSQQLLRASKPVELPSNSTSLAQRGLVKRKPIQPAVF